MNCYQGSCACTLKLCCRFFSCCLLIFVNSYVTAPIPIDSMLWPPACNGLRARVALALEKETTRFFSIREPASTVVLFRSQLLVGLLKDLVCLKSRDKLVEEWSSPHECCRPSREPPYKPSAIQHSRSSGQPPNLGIAYGSRRYGSHHLGSIGSI